MEEHRPSVAEVTDWIRSLENADEELVCELYAALTPRRLAKATQYERQLLRNAVLDAGVFWPRGRQYNLLEMCNRFLIYSQGGEQHETFIRRRSKVMFQDREPEAIIELDSDVFADGKGQDKEVENELKKGLGLTESQQNLIIPAPKETWISPSSTFLKLAWDMSVSDKAAVKNLLNAHNLKTWDVKKDLDLPSILEDFEEKAKVHHLSEQGMIVSVVIVLEGVAKDMYIDWIMPSSKTWKEVKENMKKAFHDGAFGNPAFKEWMQLPFKDCRSTSESDIEALYKLQNKAQSLQQQLEKEWSGEMHMLRQILYANESR